MFKAFKQYGINPLPPQAANDTAMFQHHPCHPVDIFAPPEEWRKTTKGRVLSEPFPAFI